MVLRIVSLTFAVLFVLFAAVQYNDPDPIRWMAMYLLAAACCFAFYKQRLHFAASSLIAVVAFVWALTLLPTVIRQRPPLAEVFGEAGMYGPGVEEAREMGGLLIAAVWLGALSLVAHRRAKATDPATARP